MADLSLFDLTGKTALVTGGAMGIGRGCATALAKAGANVAILDRNEEVGRKTAVSLKDYGVNTLFVPCDTSIEGSVSAAVDAVAKHFGRLDIAVNNAGTFAPGSDLEASKSEWDRVIGVNLTGVWLCARAEARRMIESGGGKIINIGSIAATVGGSLGSYAASKAGVVHLTKVLAVEWGGHNINVNCISPSVVSTPMVNWMLTDAYRDRLRETTPMGYVQRVEDLQGPVLFLASRASDYVTGLNLIVDGGHTLNAWTSPITREQPPRVSPAEEVAQLNDDMAAIEAGKS